MEKTIIRLTIFGLSAYMIIILICSFFGIDVSSYIHIILLEYCLYLIVKSDTKYHCKWARYLALNIFINDSFSYMDSIFNIIPNSLIFLVILSISWIVAIIATIHQAIKHFNKVNKLNNERKNRNVDKRG